MPITLPQLARELDTTDRTLRRAFEQGLLHARRPSPRRVELPLSEHLYLRRHWSLLADLRRALRTEQGLSLAVLFGSTARGDGHTASDLDLLVAFRPLRHGSAGRSRRARSLAQRVSTKLGRQVQVVSLDDAWDAPLLLADVVRDGRVLVDRGGEWADLVGERERIDRAASRERLRLDERLERFASSGRSQ